MCGKVSDENYSEIKCSECDYKCLSEHNMKEHSEKHKRQSRNADNNFCLIQNIGGTNYNTKLSDAIFISGTGLKRKRPQKDSEIECSECDYKCLSEHNMKEHSEIHKRQILNTEKNFCFIQNCSGTNYNTNISNADFISGTGLRRERPQRFVDNNRFGDSKFTFKVERNSYKGIPVVDTRTQSEVKIEQIKSEQIDIKHESISYSSSKTQQINEFDNYHEQSQNGKFIKLELTNSGWHDKNISSEGEFVKDKITEDYISLSDGTKPSNNVLGASNSLSRSYLNPLKNYGIELNVDNIGIYIPLGWKRHVFLKDKLQKDFIAFVCYYFTELGMEIRTKWDARAYLRRNPSSDLNIERLNFSTLQAKEALRHLDPKMLEFDVENTDIYIPEGWERKIMVTSYENNSVDYKIIYISPDGKRFSKTSEILSHFSNIEHNDCIDIKQLNFQLKRKSPYYEKLALKNNLRAQFSSQVSDLPQSEKFIDINVNNTGVYIPSGWERKVQMGPKLRKGVIVLDINYLTDLGKIIRSQSEALIYHKQNPSANFESERLDFSFQQAIEVFRHIDQTLLEFEVGNIGIYIPEGWERKVKISITVDLQINYNIIYIHPNGVRFSNLSEINTYLSKIEKEKYIDIGKFSFAHTKHKKGIPIIRGSPYILSNPLT